MIFLAAIMLFVFVAGSMILSALFALLIYLVTPGKNPEVFKRWFLLSNVIIILFGLVFMFKYLGI